MSRWLVLLLLAAPALAANPYDASPGRIDLFYGNHGVGMATLPGSAAGDAVDAFVGGLHADEQGALLGARVCRETGGNVACKPLSRASMTEAAWSRTSVSEASSRSAIIPSPATDSTHSFV